MELDVWTSSEIISCLRTPSTSSSSKIGDLGRWEIIINRGGGEGEAFGRRVVRPRRVVFAIGLASGVPRMPVFSMASNLGLNSRTAHRPRTQHTSR